MSQELSIYDLTKDWFDFCFENPEKINTNHSALYFFIISHSNRLGWKKKFGLPTTMTMEAIGIKSYKTYIKTLYDIVEFGFVSIVEKSKNQYSSNIVALVKITKAHTKALTKASQKHMLKQVQSTDESTYQSKSTIIIQDTILPNTNLPNTINNVVFVDECLQASQWCETVCMQNKLRPDKLEELLNEFVAHLITIQEQKKTVKEFKTHFSNWIGKKPTIQHPASLSTGTNQRQPNYDD